MLKKRLIAVVTVKNGWAVQSFGYHRYLPLGKPECVVENLDRWGADEILVKVIDRSSCGLGPDFDLLNRLGCLGLETPLIFAGGISNVEDGVRVIQSGADRILVDRILHDGLSELNALSERLGAQAVIASLPVAWDGTRIEWFDYLNRRTRKLSKKLLSAIENGSVSEILLIDWKHEGNIGEFDINLVANFPVDDLSLIAFGGLNEPGRMAELLQMPQISAIAVGNYLNYREHAIQHYKNALAGMPLRPASYETNIYR